MRRVCRERRAHCMSVVENEGRRRREAESANAANHSEVRAHPAQPTRRRRGRQARLQS